MHLYFAFAAILALLVGVAHSVLGERRIFRNLRRGGLAPTEGGTLLSERQVRILWASWHVLTVFGGRWRQFSYGSHFIHGFQQHGPPGAGNRSLQAHRVAAGLRRNQGKAPRVGWFARRRRVGLVRPVAAC